MLAEYELEILAPAGGRPAMEAAVAAGADAVYFGLQKLNARQGAENFSAEALPDTVAYLHSRQVKAYLTLNIALAQRELGLAARTLMLAQQSGVDAVLVCDPALLEMHPFFPGLTFHFSTQAGISSSAGMRAARELGLSRVVLARELSAAEVRAAAAVPGIETEVFVQGALCFSCSGRCLLSSWGGGRSGNRGSCASPCRVVWESAEGASQRPLSMYDLCLVEYLEQLRDCGVRSLKIEGRLKTASWVSAAVQLYRQTLSGELPEDELRRQASALGDYTGRPLTAGFFAGVRREITGESARRNVQERRLARPESEAPARQGLQIAVSEDERGGTLWHFSQSDRQHTLRIPPQKIAVPKRAIGLSSILERLEQVVPRSALPLQITCPPGLEEKMLPRRCAAEVQATLAEFLRRSQSGGSGTVRTALPPELNAYLQREATACSLNRRSLGAAPDTVRLGLEELALLGEASDCLAERKLILACYPRNAAEVSELCAVAATWRQNLLALSLPAVVYEDDIALLRPVLDFAREAAITIEVNSWDTWQLAREAGNDCAAGAGLAVLNANAARFLSKQGCRYSTVSSEIDAEQLQDLCQQAETALLLCVFARPALMQTRVELPAEFSAERQARLRDSRGISLRPRREGAVTVLRPEEPYDWRSLRNPQVRVAYLQVDLCGSTDPRGDLQAIKSGPFLFNYERKLR
jgi:putative protease